MYPVDVLSFRKPRPFRVGGYAETEFMPPPGTVALGLTAQLYLAGLLKARSFGDLLAKVGERVIFHGPILAKQRQLYVPSPLDMAKCPNPECKKAFLSRWRKSPKDGEIPWPIHKCGRPGKTLEGYFMSSIYLPKRGDREWELNNLGTLLKIEEVFKKEVRPGLSLEREFKRVRFGFFYQAEWVQIKPGYNLHEFVTVKDENWGRALSQVKMLRLGRKGRPTELRAVRWLSPEEYYRELTGLDMGKTAHRISSDRAFDLILLTPAIFLKDGVCRSEPVDLPTSGIELIGIATDKPVNVSGWDFEHEAPRAMYYAAPAGTVYRYRLKNDLTPPEIKNHVIRPIILENVGHWRVIGYGTAIVVPLPSSTERSKLSARGDHP